MKVALDIDGTISEHPEFFAMLSASLRAAGHLVLILTYRDAQRAQKTCDELAAWRIEHDEIVFAPTLDSKGTLCAQHQVDLLFEDQDECIVGVPESILVLKIRNGGNFDFAAARWLSTEKLTRLLR